MSKKEGWHYQVVRTTLPDGEVSLEIHEAFPSLKKKGKPLPITQTAVNPHGETIEDLRWSVKAMLKDIKRHGIVEATDYDTTPEGQDREAYTDTQDRESYADTDR